MRNKTLLIAIPLIALIAAVAAGAMWYKANNSSETEGDITAHDMTAQGGQTDVFAQSTDVNAEPQLEQPAPAAGEEAAVTPATEPATDAAAAAPVAAGATPSDIHIVADGIDPKAPKSIGKIDAPVQMIEYSSLTCPHCAHAHETVLPQLIKDYVQTGKLRIVFSDFPLNQQAMDASKVSRCVSGDQYFGILTMLFGSIEQWAYSGNHPNALIQTAILAGLPEAKARECLADTAVEQAIILSVRNASDKYRVEATPTFVLNDGKKIISGARPYAEFKQAIDAIIAGQ